MIRQIGGLTLSDYLDDILSKLNGLSQDEIEKLLYRVNNIKKDFDAEDEKPLACPFCGSVHIRKHGTTKKGTPRMKCVDCGRAWTYGEKTAFSRGRIDHGMASALITGLVENKSIRELADAMNCSESTAHAYKLIMMDILAQKLADELSQKSANGDNLFKLSGNIQMDEYFVPLSFKGKRDPEFFIKTLERFPYHHSTLEERKEYLVKNGLLEYVNSIPGFFEELLENTAIKKRGISNEQVCIIVGVDEYGKLLAEPISIGHLENNDAMSALSGRFSKGCLFITDALQTYETVAQFENIDHVAIPSDKHAKDGYNLGTINSIHSQMSKDWSKSEERIPSTKYLPQYIALFIWRWTHKDMPYSERIQLMEKTLIQGYEDYASDYSAIKQRPFTINTKGKFKNTDV